MAAEVVTPFDRGQDPKPLRAVERADRRRLRFIKRIAATHTPREKLDAALDYYRSTAKDHRVDQVKAALATEHLADRLIASADQLATTIRRNR